MAEWTQPTRILALLNAGAGRGDVEKIRDAIQKGVEETGGTVDFVVLGGTIRGRDEAARGAEKGYQLILVAGGDGSIAEAAAGLIGRSVPLGVIPTGTGNIVAVNLGIPTAPKEAARGAILGTPQEWDMGRTDDGQTFVLAAGAGYDADLIRDADRELKRRFGPLAYLLAMFKNLGVRRARYAVELDGRERIHVHAKTVIVTIVGRTMGALPLAPDAKVDDGRLDIVIFTFANVFQLALLFLKALVGQLKQDPRVRFYQAASVRITASRPIPVQIDGEAVARTTPIAIEVMPRAIRIMRPPARAPLDLSGLAGLLRPGARTGSSDPA